MTPSYINNQLLKMFRSVPTMCRLGSYSSVSISRFLLPLGDTVPKAATLGCVSSSVENTTPSKSCAYNAAVNEPTLFQPWQTSIHNECSGSGFAISGRKVLTNAHVLASHTSIKVRKHSSQSQTKPNAKVETKSPPKPKKVKTKSKAKVKNKSKARVKAIQETKSTKFCKQHRGRVKGISSGGNRICFGRYALQTLEPAWISSRQIEAGRRVMSPNVRRGGKIWVRIYPDKPVTSRPTEMRMGRGKGAPAYWVAVVKRGKILYEMTGVPERTARRAISIAASKMPIKTQFITCE